MRELQKYKEVHLKSYKVCISYYSDDSINVSLYDELNELIEYIDVYNAPDNNYDINLN